VIHAIEVNGHQQCANLVISDLAVRHSIDEEFNLFMRQRLTVSLFSDNVLRSQAVP